MAVVTLTLRNSLIIPVFARAYSGCKKSLQERNKAQSRTLGSLEQKEENWFYQLTKLVDFIP